MKVGKNDIVSSSLQWSIVVPVKRADLAKSRLHTPAHIDKTAFVRAMAMDVLTATLELHPSPRILLVSADLVLSEFASHHDIVTVADPQLGLNAAVRAGLDYVSRGPRAVLLADLPALRGSDLQTALAEAATQECMVVPDSAGTGTVLLTSQGAPMEPSFGPGSAARHARWATEVAMDLPRLRTDVDDEVDLRLARQLGLGAYSRHAWRPEH